ncbi:matrix metalloproteinase-19-like isoform X2 [Puntigrus tetrazona]|uniref:matrix metalloproteinase-19-like isoform X2 n=1 Tax=Puntigrus tetrazona TaxID=1606681 RepID=UPI001C8906BA|nr:matrix metalloproteinase-19-like isoform X2 [Puntigrus tetrazona]
MGRSARGHTLVCVTSHSFHTKPQTELRAAEMRVLVLILLSSLCAPDPAPLKDATVYLKPYAYLPSSSSAEPQGIQDEQINKALRIFQRHQDIRALTVKRAARCGLSESFSRMLTYRVLGQWRKKRLTYRFYNHAPALGWSGTRAAVRTAFSYWSAVSPLLFLEVSSGHADINIAFHRRDQGCPVAFDGPGQVLGHAEGPESGAVHFDADEVWTEGQSYGANLRIVAAHEIGHALGLGHSQFPGALMSPVFTGYQRDFRLHPDDIRGIQALYGKPVEKASGAQRKPMPDPCSAGLDALMLGPLQKTFAFRGHHVWTVSDLGDSAPISISTLWKELPGNINAAVHSQRTNKSYFLKGDQVWRYSGFKLDHGYPKRLAIPSHIQAAFFLRSRRALVFIKGSEYWLWDELGSAKPLKLRPRLLSELSSGLPRDPDAAFSSSDGRVHVFSRERFWSLSPALTPLRSTETWMRCDD